MIRRLPSLLLLVPLLSVAGAASAYQVVTTDGRTLEATDLAQVGPVFRLQTDAGSMELPEGAVDFYATFRANTQAGNVMAFSLGGFLRFESVSFSKGRVTLELGEDRLITVSEAVVDFRTSVLEGAFVQLPAGRSGSLSVAKATEGPASRAIDERSERRQRAKRASRPRNVPSAERSQTRGSR